MENQQPPTELKDKILQTAHSIVMEEERKLGQYARASVPWIEIAEKAIDLSYSAGQDAGLHQYRKELEDEFTEKRNQLFKAGQQSSQQRILGIIEKGCGEMFDYKFKEYKRVYKMECGEEQPLDESNKLVVLLCPRCEKLKSLINSPQDTTKNAFKQRKSTGDTEAGSSEPEFSGNKKSSPPNSSSSGSSNSICKCGHDKKRHFPKGSICKDCKCNKFTPQKAEDGVR